jgi:uroporphyrinogen III methyltransferase/synthase
MMDERSGKVYLVGAGPGDPGLITVKGAACIMKADVIVYDHLVDSRLLGLKRADTESVYVGKKGAAHTMEQEDINRLLVEKATENKVVCRLKGGDPFVFGRGGEEAMALAEHGIPFEIVPGVTASVAAPAYAGIPVTHRALTSTFALITGHEDPTKDSSSIDWSKVATGIGTIAFYMGVKTLPEITAKLIEFGRSPDTPAATVQWGTTSRQRTVVGTLADLAEKVQEAGITAPAITIVGEVVSLREHLSWFETRPLFGLTVMVTRARAQASDLVSLLEELGAQTVEFPTIRIEDPDDTEPLDRAIDSLDGVDWLIFTSVNGVARFMNRLTSKGRDVRELKGVKICAIGPATRTEVERHSIRVDIVPPKYVAESVVEALAAKDMAGKRVLMPRASVARSLLPDALREMGAEVDEVDAYKTVPETANQTDRVEMLKSGEVDIVTFTSSSTVRNFVELVGKEALDTLPNSVRFASIGPVTSGTARDLGVEVSIETEQHDILGLVQAIVQWRQ